MSPRGLVLAVVVYWLLLAGVQAKKKKRLEDESASPPSADKTLAMHHHQRGTMAHMQGDLVGAIEAFRSAIQAKPDFAYAYYRLGFVQHELRQAHPNRANEDPVPAFKAALALNPWDEMSHYSFGQALQDDERIAEACQKALRAHLAAVRAERARLAVTETTEASVVGKRLKVKG